MQGYSYQPLQPGEIRLLRLDPVTQPSDTLSGSLFHYRLANPTFHLSESREPSLHYDQAYEAISYHWGSDPRTPHQLSVTEPDGTQSVIPLTSSLNTVLRQLALPDKDRVLWADAICINQVDGSSNVEKAEQIKLMPDVYRVATRVQIFLGSDSDNLSSAMEFIHHISDYAEYLDDSYHVQGAIGLDLAQQNGFVLPPSGDERWPAIRAFFRRPWFRRVWVIQEFVYATDVTVTCGEHELDWRKLYLAAKAYTGNRNLVSTGFKGSLWGKKHMAEFREALEGAKAMHTIADLRIRAWGYMSPQYMVLSLDRGLPLMPGQKPELAVRRNYNSLKSFEDTMRRFLLQDRAGGKTFPFGRPGFLGLLRMTNNFLATQPRDRLYAILGLADDADNLSSLYSQEQTANEANHKFAMSFIERGRGADVLSAAGMRSDQPSIGDAPTWVPDWITVRLAENTIAGFHHMSRLLEKDEKGNTEPDAPVAPSSGQEVSGQSDPERFYKASLDAPLAVSIHPETRVISVNVTSVDMVSVVLPGKLCFGTPLYEVMVKKVGATYLTGEPMTEALWRTMTANRTYGGERPGEDFAIQYQNLKRHETVLAIRALIAVIISAFACLPFVVLGIRCLPFYTHAVYLLVLACTRRIPFLHAAVIMGLIQLLTWFHILALVPTLLLLGWYAGTRVYVLELVSLVSGMGMSLNASTGSLPQDCLGIVGSMSLTVNKYNLCFTSNRMMGLVPLLAKAGDRVAIIHGCDAPCVVRPTDRQGYYQLVGECYMHGIMDGEAMGGKALEICLV